MIAGKLRHSKLRTAATATLAVGVAAVVAACSSGGSGGSGGSGASGSSGGKVSGSVKIITWVNPPAVTALTAIDKEFEQKYPGVKVTLQTAANVNGPYQTLLQQTVNSGSADIVTANTPFQPLPLNATRSNETPIQYWTTAGAFAPLNGQSFLNDYTSAAQAAETYQGKTYGLVSGEYQEGVFYNKQVFARYNLTPPTTYSQFLALCSKLKSHGVQPLYTALGNVGAVYLQFEYYEMMTDLMYPSAPGGDLATDLMKGTVKWTDPNFIKGMNEEKTIAQYLEPNYTGVPWESMPGNFAKGDAAMLLDGSWDLASVQQANPKLQVGYFPLPFSNTAADNQAYAQDDLTFSVLNSSPNKAAAMKWLAFYSSPSVYAQYVKITGISPSQAGGTFNGYAADVMGSWFGK
ncbi:MAG TPA: extracellular solute-binding protein, partial [Trebonia sp.]|nr:extracellular solute-binding protein [Trebonia sp.]